VSTATPRWTRSNVRSVSPVLWAFING
jgi:hypothetical protein